MRVFVVRHGCAGDKRLWTGPDADRPLDAAGFAQADALAALFADAGIRRVASSPTRRCRDTVAPLARWLGLMVEDLRGLGPAADGTELLALMTDDLARDAVLCTHGENMRPALATLRAAGVPVGGDDRRLVAKGTGWAVTVDPSGAIASVEPVAPKPLIRCAAHGSHRPGAAG